MNSLYLKDFFFRERDYQNQFDFGCGQRKTEGRRKTRRTLRKWQETILFVFFWKILQAVTSQMELNQRPRPSGRRSKLSKTTRTPWFPLWGAWLCMAEMLSFPSNRGLSQVGPPLEAQREPDFQKSHCGNRGSKGVTTELQRGGVYCEEHGWITELGCSAHEREHFHCHIKCTHTHGEEAWRPKPVIPGLRRFTRGSLYFTWAESVSPLAKWRILSEK